MERSPNVVQLIRWLLVRLCCLSLVLLLLGIRHYGVSSPDVVQSLSDQPTDTRDERYAIGQTFLSRHARLTAIEVRLVVLEGAAQPRSLAFHLRASPQANADIANAIYDVSALHHNDVVRFNFPPQSDSAGKSYYVLIESMPDSGLALWSSAISNYEPGALFLDSQPQAGDLAFSTFYDYDLGSIAFDVVQSLANYGWLLLPLAIILLIPGLAILSTITGLSCVARGSAARRASQKRDTGLSSFNLIEALGISVALSLAAIPALFLWASALGLHLSPLMLALILVGLTLIGALSRIRRRERSHFSIQAVDRTALLSFMVVFALILILRFVNIKGLVLPLWVDSVHHAALARLIAAQGALPTSYRPFADVEPVFYHLGFHSVLAVLSWFTGLDIEKTMLLLGQILNSLACVSAYVLAARWTGRAVGGLVAMVVVGALSLMPAYYVTWGRYTQLDGLVILPLALLFTQMALDNGTKRFITLAGLLAAGLFLVHYRVTLFLATFTLAYLLYQTISKAHHCKTLLRLWSRALLIGVVASFISAPWLWHLLNTIIFPLDTFTARMTGTHEYNEVPWNLITSGQMPILLILSAIGVLLALWQRHGLALVTIIWIGLTILAVNPSAIGLNPTWIINNFSVVIALFLPVAILVAFCVSGLLQIVEPRITPTRFANLTSLLSFALVLLALWTAKDMLNIVNPVTNLADDDDRVALQWIREATPADAIFLVNERRWQGAAYVGTDGGYWIPHLSGRRTTMPIALYTYGSPAYVDEVNSLARRIEAEPDPDDPSFLDSLRTRGVTHVYIGAKGGPLSLIKLAHSSHYEQIYERGAAYVFAVRY